MPPSDTLEASMHIGGCSRSALAAENRVYIMPTGYINWSFSRIQCRSEFLQPPDRLRTQLAIKGASVSDVPVIITKDSSKPPAIDNSNVENNLNNGKQAGHRTREAGGEVFAHGCSC